MLDPKLGQISHRQLWIRRIRRIILFGTGDDLHQARLAEIVTIQAAQTGQPLHLPHQHIPTHTHPKLIHQNPKPRNQKMVATSFVFLLKNTSLAKKGDYERERRERERERERLMGRVPRLLPLPMISCKRPFFL